MNTYVFTWELDRLFGAWNSAIQQINDWIHKAGKYRSTIVLNISMCYSSTVTTLVNDHYGKQTSFSPDHITIRNLIWESTTVPGWRLQKWWQPWPSKMTHQINPHLLGIINSWNILQPHRLSRINNTHLSVDPEMKTSGVTTSLSSLQTTNF